MEFPIWLDRDQNETRKGAQKRGRKYGPFSIDKCGDTLCDAPGFAVGLVFQEIRHMIGVAAF
jgi:hypothetical protein